MQTSDIVLMVHALSTGAMCGLIWFVQVVHYPLKALVGRAEFVQYQSAHQARTTLVVMPLMLAEAGSAAWIAVSPPPGVPAALAYVGVGMLLAVWASTFLVQVPLHARLTNGFDARTHRLLVSSNWVRTVLWTARGGLAVWMLTAAA